MNVAVVACAKKILEFITIYFNQLIAQPTASLCREETDTLIANPEAGKEMVKNIFTFPIDRL